MEIKLENGYTLFIDRRRNDESNTDYCMLSLVKILPNEILPIHIKGKIVNGTFLEEIQTNKGLLDKVVQNMLV